MDCDDIQEQILESFETVLSPIVKDELERHMIECPDCAEFAASHRQLDLQLHQAIVRPQLSSTFRTGLQARIAREGREPWPDWLPDVAYVAGVGVAIGSCAFLLPLPLSIVLRTGSLLALVAYLLQTLLISALEPQIE
jgi:hypothetical protein